MGTRSVLKDAARALQIDHNEVNQITKFVPSDSGQQWTLSDCLYGNEKKERQPVKEIVDYAKKHPRLFQVAVKLEGMPRHSSIHAAGVIICPRPVRELIPLMRGGNGEVVSQIEMGFLEKLGLLKMDFLGLRTLGAVHRTLDLIEKRHGIKIDTDKIDLNDPDTMKLVSTGFTDGIFQIESDGMKAMFRSMNQVNFENIVAGIALNGRGH
jgi:DNA polymerase-3 subunit alpha